MNNEDNVYFTLAQTIKNNTSNNNTIQTVNLGKIISVSPLLISCNGIQLDREDLYINKDLLKGTKRKVGIKADDVTGNLITEHGGTLESFNMADGTIENLEDNFKVNDTVVLLTSDNQKFILLSVVI